MSATINPPAGPPPLPLTYTDLVCLDDLDPFAAETKNDLQNLGQDVFHVLLEVAGTNLDDIQRGVGVEQFLSGTTANLTNMATIIEQQLLQDNRIDTCHVTITATGDASNTYKVVVNVGVDGSVLGLPFSLSPTAGLSLNSFGNTSQ